MSINAISRGLVLYLAAIFGCVTILNLSDFIITEREFTIFLVSSIFVIGFYTGYKSKSYSTLNGFLIGTISSILILMLISPYVEMHWDLNFMIMVVWVSVAIGGSSLGGFLYKTLEKKREMILKKFDATSKVYNN